MLTKTNNAVLPLPYDPAYEVLEDGEAETQQELSKTLTKISEVTFKDSGHATRSVHAKSHGLLIGNIEIFDGLPPQLAQGMFAKAANLPVVIRFSTIPGDMLDDNVSVPRGMALKIVGVEGARLMGSEPAKTQDFVLVNGPAFLAPKAKKFLSSLKLLAATTDKAPGLKKALSTVLQGTEKLIEAVGGESATIKSMGGHPETNLLGETYFSQAPILYGDYMAKISIAPACEALTQLKNAPVDLSDNPNGIREAVIDFFKLNTAVWELRVQLCTDLEIMPIEDSSIVWPEQVSPYVAVARITVKPQVAWSDARSSVVDDCMSFSPWHGIAAHRPIGSIMRVRKMAYEMSARFRTERNGLTIAEPVDLNNFPN
ncbi:MAG: catalase family protein [Bdellovibrio sp.]|nr:catalase family protein [Methylotenera sp.]